MSQRIVFSTIAVVYFFFGIGTSYADILGCYKSVHGQLRVVDSFEECLPSEEPIVINQASGLMTGEYLGELCLAMPEYENALRFRIGVFHLGDRYYSLSGIQMSEVGEADALSGSAVEIDGSLVMIVTVVRKYTDDLGQLLTSQMGQIKYNEETDRYDLVMIDVKQYEDSGEHEHIGDDYASLIAIPCP